MAGSVLEAETSTESMLSFLKDHDECGANIIWYIIAFFNIAKTNNTYKYTDWNNSTFRSRKDPASAALTLQK